VNLFTAVIRDDLKFIMMVFTGVLQVEGGGGIYGLTLPYNMRRLINFQLPERTLKTEYFSSINFLSWTLCLFSLQCILFQKPWAVAF